LLFFLGAAEQRRATERAEENDRQRRAEYLRQEKRNKWMAASSFTTDVAPEVPSFIKKTSDGSPEVPSFINQ